jgi:hypothetical protein
VPKKRKLNSTNPKYWSKEQSKEPVIKERRLVKDGGKIRVYAVFM